MRREDVNVIIGRNIRIRRSLRGLSQTALARRLGVRFQQVQKYETGANAVSPARLVQLSRLFGCGVEDLFRDPARDQQTLAFIPGRRTLHLVQNFERLESVELQKRIGNLVHLLAELAKPHPERPS
jgi:transcriptional regulator with XRE-family HTH domain